MTRAAGDPGQRPGWCIHYGYKPGLGPTCEAGCNPERFLAEAPRDSAGKLILPLMQTQPCFLDGIKSKPDAAHCEKLRLPTPEEVALHEEWVRLRMEKHAIVATAVNPWRKLHFGQRFAEVIECPACKGRLHLSIEGRKGHIHGRCETEGCVSWME